MPICNLKTLWVYGLSLLLIAQPVPLLAQTSEQMSTWGLDAYEHGETLVEGINAVTPTMDEDGNISIPSVTDGVFSDSGRTLSADDLYPDTTTGSFHTTDELMDVSDDDAGMLDMGNDVQSQLWDDAYSGTPTSAGVAYGLMSEQANTVLPDMSEDPMFLFTRAIYEDLALNEDFSDCETVTTYTPDTTLTHLPDLKQCNRVIDRSGTCSAHHHYEADVIRHHSGPYNLLPLDDDSFHIWVGNLDADNRWDVPTCTIFEVETQFTVIRPEAITAVTLERVQWDDRVQLWLGKAGEEQLVYTGPGPFPETYAGVSYPNGLLPPETPGDCELSESWDRSPNLDVTDAFLAGVEAGDRVRLFSRVSVHGGGELFARLRIDYDRDLAIDDTAWTPADCVASAQAIEDGFATGSISCLATPVEVPAGSGCTHINGVTVCESDLNPSPFVGVSSLCEQVEITTEYNFYVGDYTYIDETGTEVTITGGGGDLDRCSAYEADSSCAFVAQTCVEGAEVDGNCYVYEETWDCGYAVEVREVASETTYDCAGPISCMGMDCIDPTPESSESFAETAALLNAVQYMAQDTNCVPIDGTEDVICDIFGGENHYCKIAVGGAQDCCDVPTGVNVFDYLQAIRSMARLDSALMAVDSANPALGAYRTLRAPIAKSVSYVTKPFTTAVENVKGTVSKIVEPIGTFIDGVKTKVQNAVKDVLTKMFRSAGTGVNGAGAAAGGTNMLSDEATEEAADQAAEAAAEGVMENMASAANVMMTAFAIYSATMLAIQLLYECEDQEFQLASKRDVEACNHVGSYCHSDSPFGCIENRRTFCCYNSPLSRIINPQIKAQLGLDMGTDEAPNCSGFTIDQITATDWSLIDLSEWNALLTDNGLFPDETMDMDSLTGTGSELQSINEVAGDADRLNATDRATERLDGLDIDALNREAYENTAVNADGR